MRKAPTKDDLIRFRKLQELGCIIFGEFHGVYVEPDVHHLTEGYRLGHRYTIPLSPYFHRGIPPDGMTTKEAEEKFGPSLAANKKEFVKQFGTERELLQRVDLLIQCI